MASAANAAPRELLTFVTSRLIPSADCSQLFIVAEAGHGAPAARDASACSMPAAKALASSGRTSQLAPSTAISGIPPTRLATKGVRQASDSRSTLGTPSERLGNTTKSAQRYQSGN